MNKFILTALALTTVLASCSKTTSSAGKASGYNKIVLGAFNDQISEQTLDEAALSDLPRLVDLSADMTPAKNQDDRGTCTFFSTMAVVEGAVKKAQGVDVNFSEEYLNYTTKRMGSFAYYEGSTVLDNIRGLYKGGLLLESDWSYQASWFQKGLPCADFKPENSLSPAMCFTHNKPNKAAAAKLISAQNISFHYINKNTNDIIRHLAEQKSPLTMSVAVNFNGWPKNSGEVSYNEELRAECLADPSSCGGHSIVITGYDMDKRVFMFKNSWGKEWGKNGYGTIPFDVVDQYVTEELYYAEMTAKIELPEEAKPLSLNKFEVKISTEEDRSISINVDTDLTQTSGKMLYMSSYLVKKSKNYEKENPSDGNTELIRIAEDDVKAAGDNYVRSMTYVVPQEDDSLVVDSNDGALLVLEANMLNVPSLEEIMGSQSFDKVVRTTVYVHDDIAGFKVLKRIYSPLK